MGHGRIVAAPWWRGERGYGGNLPADRSGAADAGGRGSLGAAPGNCFTRQAGGRGTAAFRGERRRSGDRADGSGTDRLAARRRAVVWVSDGATLFLAPHSVAVCGKSRTRSRNVPAVLSPDSGMLRPQRDRRLRPNRAA